MFLVMGRTGVMFGQKAMRGRFANKTIVIFCAVRRLLRKT
jgi:hypothetical protein